jgi:2-polyprenyl-6-methoxyphenol hydroxylase-like FAD-dependent oxidoreductase
MDVVWFKLPEPKFLEGNEHARAYVGGGHLLLFAPVPGNRVQIAWIIAKGGFRAVRERGMAACLEEMAAQVSSDVAEHLRASGAAMMEPFLLSTVSDRVTEWTRPGLLVIGDAAHTMSPVGGQGLNLALRDAVVAANHLVPVLSGSTSGAVDPAAIDAAARRVQDERMPEIVRIQSLQAIPPRLLFRQGRLPSLLLRAAAFFLRTGLVPPFAGSVARSFFFGVTNVQLRV